MRNLIPGPHASTIRRLTGNKVEVPVITDGERVIQGSSEIITWLDENYVAKQLSPQDEAYRKEILEWEEYLDRELGESLRLWFYFHMLPDRRRTTAFLLQGAAWYGHAMYAVMFRYIKQKMIKLMHINAFEAAKAHTRFINVIERLNRRLADRDYLVGDSFTRADLTASALFSPMIKFDPNLMTPPAREFWECHRNGTFIKEWVQTIYRRHRNNNKQLDLLNG